MWNSDSKPDEDVGVLVAVNNEGTIQTHLRAAAWDGTEWVDVDGLTVDGVVAWTEIPQFGGGTAK